jgi:hypothetical protein
MSKTVNEILKEATEGMLTDETLELIEEAFNSAVGERAQLHVEKALIEQDEEYAGKLTKLLETIDGDHSAKLQKVVEAIDKNHAQKLATIVKKYTSQLNEEAEEFKTDIVSKVSNYLELYLEEAVPAEEIKEAVKSKKAQGLLEQLRNTLGIDFALSQDAIKEAVMDGKKQITEATKTNVVVATENDQLKEQLANTQSELILERMSAELPEAKKNYIHKILSDKGPDFIKENFDYTLKMFDKSEEERLEQLQEEATEDRKIKVDRPTVNDIVSESTEVQADKNHESHPIFNQYMDELSKT